MLPTVPPGRKGVTSLMGLSGKAARAGAATDAGNEHFVEDEGGGRLDAFDLEEGLLHLAVLREEHAILGDHDVRIDTQDAAAEGLDEAATNREQGDEGGEADCDGGDGEPGGRGEQGATRGLHMPERDQAVEVGHEELPRRLHRRLELG